MPKDADAALFISFAEHAAAFHAAILFIFRRHDEIRDRDDIRWLMPPPPMRAMPARLSARAASAMRLLMLRCRYMFLAF